MPSLLHASNAAEGRWLPTEVTDFSSRSTADASRTPCRSPRRPSDQPALFDSTKAARKPITAIKPE
jgi:hypothetical protein